MKSLRRFTRPEDLIPRKSYSASDFNWLRSQCCQVLPPTSCPLATAHDLLSAASFLLQNTNPLLPNEPQYGDRNFFFEVSTSEVGSGVMG